MCKVRNDIEQIITECLIDFPNDTRTCNVSCLIDERGKEKLNTEINLTSTSIAAPISKPIDWATNDTKMQMLRYIKNLSGSKGCDVMK